MSTIFANIDAPFSLAVEHVTQDEFEEHALSDWLTVGEQARYSELQTSSVAKRSRQWVLGRYAAKVACRYWLQEQGENVVGWKNIQISNDETGMPFLMISDISDPPTLSIAHSGEEAIAAVAAPGCQIGVDIERHAPHADFHALAKRICSDAEYQRWFADITDAELSKRFNQLWLAKEAAAKCTGRGLRWRPGAFELLQLYDHQAKVRNGEDYYAIHYAATTGTAFASLAWPLPG